MERAGRCAPRVTSGPLGDLGRVRDPPRNDPGARGAALGGTLGGARPLPRSLTFPALRVGARHGPQDQGLSAEGRRGQIEGNVGTGEAAERKEGGRKGAREGRTPWRLAEKGLSGHAGSQGLHLRPTPQGGAFRDPGPRYCARRGHCSCWCPPAVSTLSRISSSGWVVCPGVSGGDVDVNSAG